MKNAAAVLRSFNEAQSQLVVQTADLPLGTLAGMVESGAIDLEPGFQRRERWKIEQQSALIESFLLNVPVPPVYLAEEANGTYTAIDGKQRLRAIADYINGKYALKNLEKLSEAEGLQFDDLPSEITNALRLRPFIRVVTLLKQTHVSLKYEVFLRLNRGGESLNPQEIRNVAFRGNLNDRIYYIAEHSDFLRQQLKITDDKSSAFREMSDAEYVLRFLALNERFSEFSGSLVREMDSFMARHQYAGADEIEDFAFLFSDTLDRCRALWGVHAFKRPEGNGWRDQMLAGMYDAQMLSVAQISKNQFTNATKHTVRLLKETRKLFEDQEFEKAVRAGTNTPARIVYRVSRLKEILQGI